MKKQLLPKSLLIVITLLLMTACLPLVELNEPFVLPAGHYATLAREDFRISFDEVVSDSRCPIDLYCITGGTVIGSFTVHTGDKSLVVSLKLGDLNRPTDNQTSIGDYVITLLEINPAPIMDEIINPNDYMATLLVELI